MTAKFLPFLKIPGDLFQILLMHIKKHSAEAQKIHSPCGDIWGSEIETTKLFSKETGQNVGYLY
jgi:hypothetical protein